ncbi:hypothetical protein JS562_54095, partial [Agrobacterium sp. S2]|nr:hypothetical protein [Agrobacterium sp. S2]
MVEKTAMAMRPIQKYGTVEKNVATGTTRSAFDPRRQPMKAPDRRAEEEAQDRGDADQADGPRQGAG